MYTYSFSFRFDFFFVPVIIVEKDREVLELMINHGVLEGLCEIFSTSQDEDLLV